MQAPKLRRSRQHGRRHGQDGLEVLRAATEQLATIAGQQPSVRRRPQVDRRLQTARGQSRRVGRDARGDRGYEFLDRLVSIAIPLDPDFRGLTPVLRWSRQLLDGRPRADHLPRNRLRPDRPGPRHGHHDHDLRDLRCRGLRPAHAFGLPFSADRRPRGFETLDVEGTVEGGSGHPTPGCQGGAGREETPAAEEPSAAEETPATDEPARCRRGAGSRGGRRPRKSGGGGAGGAGRGAAGSHPRPRSNSSPASRGPARGGGDEAQPSPVSRTTARTPEQEEGPTTQEESSD